jgi:integrase
MAVQHLTDAIIKRLPLPERGSRKTYDARLPGFGVCATAAGWKSYILRYRPKGSGRERCITIGATNVWRLTEALAEAKRLKRIVDQGGDPLGDLQAERDAPTLSQLLARFEEEHFPRVRESTRQDYGRLIKNHVRPFFGDHAKVADVRFDDIDRLHRKVTDSAGPYAGNRVIAMLSKAFNLSIRWEWRESNPCRGVGRNPEHARRRYLSSDELARLTAALADHQDRQASDIIRVLLLTGSRRGEVLGMRWCDLDLGTGVWSKPAHKVKQGRDHISPLNAPARALLSGIREEQTKQFPNCSEYVFAVRGGRDHRRSIKRNWAAILKAAGITGLRIHDLRHSFASQLVSSGASLPLIGALLGHSNPATTQRYAHLHDDPQREAVERVGSLIMNAGKEAKPPTKLRG